ncbi:RtcB family protein [bacterium]|nr:RtcB family protein [bacterium]
MKIINKIPVWNTPDENALRQILTCAKDESVAGAALMADHHKGYSMPIGGVVAYRNKVSPSGVGYDISCGNKAIKTDLTHSDIRHNIKSIMDEIFSRISFGIGRVNEEKVDDPLFDLPVWREIPYLKKFRSLAEAQLGTVGSGNHFIDILVDQDDQIWVADHFGSRGLGHRIATGFMNLAHGRKFEDSPRGENMDAPATVLDLRSQLGQDYWQCMELAGRYAYAGRDWVCDRVLKILGAKPLEQIHNHHNFAWEESHNGEKLIVVRKGATPAFPGQKGFIGGSMGDNSVIIEGIEHQESQLSFYSTVHGAGRVMSRRAAAGKWHKNKRGHRVRSGGEVSDGMMLSWIKEKGVELRGAGVDESPHCYRRLNEVLNEHQNSIKILYVLRPIGVAMAGEDVFDPYKD